MYKTKYSSSKNKKAWKDSRRKAHLVQASVTSYRPSCRNLKYESSKCSKDMGRYRDKAAHDAY